MNKEKKIKWGKLTEDIKRKSRQQRTIRKTCNLTHIKEIKVMALFHTYKINKNKDRYGNTKYW